jgi:hypothetical protein
MCENLAKFLTGGNRENGDVKKECSLDVFRGMSVYARPHLFSSPPQERKWLSLVSGFADERPANPVV